jgi:hypothetical protein
MLAKLTSKNQLTLPKAAVQALGSVEYFDVLVREGQIVLTPVRIQRGDTVRAKLAALQLTDTDIADAVRWARQTTGATHVAEPESKYRTRVPRGRKRQAEKGKARHR